VFVGRRHPEAGGSLALNRPLLRPASLSILHTSFPPIDPSHHVNSLFYVIGVSKLPILPARYMKWVSASVVLGQA
jgi:hypothetical protein